MSVAIEYYIFDSCMCMHVLKATNRGPRQFPRWGHLAAFSITAGTNPNLSIIMYNNKAIYWVWLTAAHHHARPISVVVNGRSRYIESTTKLVKPGLHHSQPWTTLLLADILLLRTSLAIGYRYNELNLKNRAIQGTM